ncbi:unnamed protein product [Absidia cylindrospora]
MTTIGPGGVTRTEVDFDSSTILLPYTGADKVMSSIPFGGATRTVVQVEDEATTLPIHVRPTPQPFNNRMLEEVIPFVNEIDQVADNIGLAVAGGSNRDEKRLALDAIHLGKLQALAVGDDGISGTVLRHIKFDRDGNPIIPSNAGTRPVYVINGRTTTLRNGIPPSFPVDNGHTRTVVALRSGVVTLPLSGGDEITKLLPIDGLTETVVVFDEMTYTLSPDDPDNGSNPSRTVPSRLCALWLSKKYCLPYHRHLHPPRLPRLPQTLQLFLVSLVLGPSVSCSTMLCLPLKTIHAIQTTNVPASPKSTPSSSSSTTATSIITSDRLSTQSHCSTKWVLDNAQEPEGCYLLSSVVAVDSNMRDVGRQGYWTTNQCHSFCANSTQIHQLPSFASWYYGLTVSATVTDENENSSRSSTCRCLADLSGAQSSTIRQCGTLTLPSNVQGENKLKKQRLGLYYPDDDEASSTIYIYHATYRCLPPSLMKRNAVSPSVSHMLDPPDTWRCQPNALMTNKRKSEGCYPYLAPKVTTRKERSDVDGIGWYWTAARCYSYCFDSGRVPTRGKWYYGITVADPGSALMKNSCLCMLEMGAAPTATGCQNYSNQQKNTTDQDSTTKIGIVNANNLDTAAIYAYEVDYTCSYSCNSTNTNNSSAFKISDTKATEGCYALSDYADRAIKKVSRLLTRDGRGGYTPDECFRICNTSGLMVPGQPWWYGISMSDPADTRRTSIGSSSCRCSVKAPSPSRYDFLAGRCNHDDVGLVDNRFLYRINNGVYVYKVSYQCPTLTQNTE